MAEFVERKPDPGVFPGGAFILFLILILLVLGIGFLFI